MHKLYIQIKCYTYMKYIYIEHPATCGVVNRILGLARIKTLVVFHDTIHFLQLFMFVNSNI